MAGKRAVIWAAVSSEEQARGDKASLQYQEQIAREHAARHGLDIADVITSDDSRTVTRFDVAAQNPRLGYGRLAEHLERGDFDVLLYYDTTRLGRKMSLIATVQELCIDAGVVLYDCSNPPHTLDVQTTETDRYVRAFHAVNSQGEIDKLRRRHQFGMIGRVTSGRMANNACWGYSVGYDGAGRQVVELDPNVAAVVRDVFALYLEGHGAPRMAEMLAAANMEPLPPGGKWTPSAVKSIIDRVWRYAGYAELNRRSPAGRPYVRARGQWEAAIDDATAEAVTAEREYRANNRRAPDTQYRLSGLCVCATCGAVMHISHQQRKARHGYDWYAIVCRKHAPGEYVSYAHVMRFVRAMIETLDLAQIDAAGDTDELAAIAAAMERQRQAIAAAEAAIARAADAYTDGAMDAANYRRQVERKQAAAAAARAELDRLEQRAAAERQSGSRRARLQRASEIGLAMLDHPDPAAANAYLRGLLRITIHRNRAARGDWI
jgi:DNA invertase Pin-like site-specific DNA recombinase